MLGSRPRKSRTRTSPSTLPPRSRMRVRYRRPVSRSRTPLRSNDGEHVVAEHARPEVAVVASIVAEEMSEAGLEVRALGVLKARDGEQLANDRGWCRRRSRAEWQRKVERAKNIWRSSLMPELTFLARIIAWSSSDGSGSPVWWCRAKRPSTLFVPDPVLEHLGWRLDEVAFGLRAAELEVSSAGQRLVEDVPELVEERHHFAVAQERRRVWRRAS